MNEPQSSEYRRGFSAGFMSGQRKAYREIEGKSTEPKVGKYGFVTMSVGDEKVITMEDRAGAREMYRIYHAGRKWSQRNAPSRKFSIRPCPEGAVIARTA